ncbi:MAG: glycosyltransferase [Chitinivibrionales bacterium]|nr:glycosyltransferase [Chitinivibrionales bacterium]
MKLLLTIDFPPEYGGMQKYLAAIVKHTFAPGDRVLAGAARSHHQWQFETGAVVEYVSTPLSLFNKKLSLIPLLIRAYCLAAGSPEVELECGNIWAGCVGRLLSPATRRPYRVFTYATELVALRRPGLKSLLLKQVLIGAHSIYVLGEYTRKLLLELGIDKPLHVCPPRLDTSEFPKVATRSADDNTIRLLCVGRLVKHKGHSLLIDALAKLPSDATISTIIAGEGPERKLLERQRSDLHLEDRLRLFGRLTNAQLTELYQSSDIFVFPSLEAAQGAEGFGIVLLEAMYYRLPIIASRAGGIVEVVEGCAELVLPGDADALCDALLRVCRDPGLRRRMIENGTRRLYERYVW